MERDLLRANEYNPNYVASPELDLLRVSLLTDGWTVPLVVSKDFEIIDGFHRWKIAGEPEIAAMSDGKIPVVILDVDPAEQRASTIRYNRARGTHAVTEMANLIRYLKDNLNIPDERIRKDFGMEQEEIERLYDNSGMVMRGSMEDFNKGWVPERK